MSQVSRLILALAAVAVPGGATPSAKAGTITSDSLSAMTATSSGTAVPASARLSDQLPGLGVRFSSTSDFVAVVNLGSDHATSGIHNRRLHPQISDESS